MVHLANHMFHLTHILCFELQELLPCNAAIEQRVVLPSYHGGGKYEVYMCAQREFGIPWKPFNFCFCLSAKWRGGVLSGLLTE